MALFAKILKKNMSPPLSEIPKNRPKAFSISLHRCHVSCPTRFMLKSYFFSQTKLLMKARIIFLLAEVVYNNICKYLSKKYIPTVKRGSETENQFKRKLKDFLVSIYTNSTIFIARIYVLCVQVTYLVTHTIVQESHNFVQCMSNVYITCDLQYLILLNIILF